MKPVVVFRHAASEGAGYLGQFLDQKEIVWEVVRIDRNDAIPTSARDFSGLVFMGGPMSVNDPLPWIPPLLDLIREAVSLDIPVLGHCLGGQLISKALGAEVTKNPVKEIGWGEVTVSDNPTASEWFGTLDKFQGFHWHGETFGLPDQAVHLLASQYCKNQAYALGKHIAFQCHIEMTEKMVQTWCEIGLDEIRASSDSPSVYQPEEIKHDLQARISTLSSIAHPIYERWIQGLVR
ncbi:MAG: type 1 glutamine amidotransferase [Methylophilaceae bacterium]